MPSSVAHHLRYVVHMDILGMSTLVARDPERAWQTLTGLVAARNRVNSLGITFIDTAEEVAVPSRVHAVTFSDTIVLFSASDEVVDLRTIVVATCEMFNAALASCVPIRVGIAHGQFFFNLTESMYAGPALIEAYRLGEEAQWLGLVASETVYLRSKAVRLQSRNTDVLIPEAIPVRGGTRNGYAVNWPDMVERRPGIAVPITVEQFYSAFEPDFGPFVALPADAQAKYLNTVRFYNTRASAA